MILPIITSIARDIFLQTPKLLEEAALGLGATKWEMIKLSVLPFGKSGVISASMLGLGRALGETMAVLMILSPGLLEEAALGLGATKWEMIKLSVLPFGKSGVISASMLGLGRALGETMAVLMILSPGLKYSFKLLQASQNQTIAANIAAQYPEADGIGVSVLIGTGLVLFVITFLVNLLARRITEKARK